MDIVRVGQSGAPPRGTLDPDLLLWAEVEGRALISQDKDTMPNHVADHLANGHHTWGVFILRRGHRLSAFVNDLVLFWNASQAEDWIDQIEYLPWSTP